jgi:hypothetical protein
MFKALFKFIAIISIFGPLFFLIHGGEDDYDY